MIKLFDQLPRWLVLELVIPLTLINAWFLVKGIEYFQDLLSVLLVATLLAFFLNYPTRWLENRGLGKGASVMIVCVVAVGLLSWAGTVIVPTLLQQLDDFTTLLPSWIESGQQRLQAVDSEIAELPMSESVNLNILATQFFETIPGQLRLLPNQILSLALGTADTLVDSLFTAVLTLYCLLFGETFWDELLGQVPNGFGQRVQCATRDQFHRYFVGQATLASLKGLLLTAVFFLAGIPYWLVFGFGIAISGLIPFGVLLGTIAVGLFAGINDPMLGVDVAIACVVIDQLVDNIIAPRILGDAVGLNPIWILLSLLVGIQVAGILGALVSVPVAGAIRQLIADIRLAVKTPTSADPIQIVTDISTY